MQEVDAIIQLTQALKAEGQRLGFDLLGIAHGMTIVRDAAEQRAKEGDRIADPSSASVSYPTFWEHLSQLAQEN